MLGKAAPKMQCACFVTKASVNTAPPEQVATFLSAFLSTLLIHQLGKLCMIAGSIKYAEQNLLQSDKTPSQKWLSGDLLDQAYKSTEQLEAPILAVAKKY